MMERCKLNFDGRADDHDGGDNKGFQNPHFKPMNDDDDVPKKAIEKSEGPGNKKKGLATGGINPEEMNKMIFQAMERNRIPNVFYEELEILEIMGLSTRNTTGSGFYNGFTVECPTNEKRIEKNKRLFEIKHTMEKIKELKKQPNYDENELSELLRIINRIKAEFMTENKFFGYVGKEEDAFNYGRDVVKGSLDDKMILPYKRIELFQFASMISMESNVTREHNFVYSGVKRGAIMKGGIRLTTADFSSTKIDIHDPAKNFEFDIYKQFLLNIFKETCQIKVRFYVLRALNLAAQANAIELKYELGGYNAMSTANSYPVVSVGDARNDVNSGVTKRVTDEKSPVEQTLNPDYFKMYELDAFLPADWRLVLMVYNKGLMMFDSLIGERVIDVEDRYYSDLFRLRTYSYERRNEKNKDQIKQLNSQNPVPVDEIMLKEQEGKELAKYLKPLLQSRPLNPIEYCYLTQPGLNTMQGSAEILIEALHLTETRKIPAAKFEPPKPVKYQIRLIIWEAFEIPKGDRKAIDVFFKVTLNNEGWTADEITKETDTHMGSDGYCIYNWRMTFDLSLPCSFPRLKIVAFDMATFGSDESIGEVTLKFDTIMNKLKNEGRYESPQRKVKLRNIKAGGTEAGDVLISFKIIQTSEAASNPVGDGQDEPNTDPVLEKPKMGRGMGDFFKSLDFKFNFSFGLLFIIMQYVALAGAGVMIFAVLFINPGLLT